MLHRAVLEHVGLFLDLETGRRVRNVREFAQALASLVPKWELVAERRLYEMYRLRVIYANGEIDVPAGTAEYSARAREWGF